MQARLRASTLTVFVVLLFSSGVFSGSISDSLILQDIGPYKKMGEGGGQGSGILAAAGHFSEDHSDESYGALYYNDPNEIGVRVEVTQHAGGDSDKWLLHEAERGYRDTDDQEERLGLLHSGSRLTNIGNSMVFRYWSTYRWISNHDVIVIDYGDPLKPEPLEVVQAYLQKLPSTIPANLVLDKAHDEKWIKDEIERRLWLCDKWFQQLDEGMIEQYKALSAVVDDHLEVFLDYREKYYGMGAAQEKKILYGYVKALNEKEIRNKLTEYKQWWAENKTKPINL